MLHIRLRSGSREPKTHTHTHHNTLVLQNVAASDAAAVPAAAGRAHVPVHEGGRAANESLVSSKYAAVLRAPAAGSRSRSSKQTSDGTSGLCSRRHLSKRARTRSGPRCTCESPARESALWRCRQPRSSRTARARWQRVGRRRFGRRRVRWRSVCRWRVSWRRDAPRATARRADAARCRRRRRACEPRRQRVRG